MKIKDFNQFHRSVTFYSVYIICPIANVFSYFFYKINFTPNCITILSAIMAIMGSIFLVFSINNINLLSLSIVFILWNLSYVFDICDGQIARARKIFSKIGEWLDHSLDSFNKFIVTSAMFYICYLTIPNEYKEKCFIVYATAIGSILCIFNAVMCKDFIFGKKSDSSNDKYNENLLIHILRFFMSFTNQAIQFWFLYLLLYPKLFLVISFFYYSLYMAGYFLYIFIRFYKHKGC